MKIPENLKYTKTHEWARVEGDVAVVGITDHAQHELTDIVYVELPQLDARVEESKEAAIVESVKAASDIYAPVSGGVVAINNDLAATPELINKDPYGKGWMFKVRMSDSGQLGELLTAAQYAKHIGSIGR